MISVRPRFADALLTGSKCVELRRRKPGIEPGTRVWFYSTLPVGKVVGVGLLKEVVLAPPEALWHRFSHCAGLEQNAFDGYFGKLSRGVALMFSEVAPLIEPLDLEAMRLLKPNFQPPQFYQWVRHCALSSALNSARLGETFVACDH